MRLALATAAALAGLVWTASSPAQVAPPAPEAIAVGDWQLVPVVELRVRGDYRHDLDEVDRGLLLERFRLGVDAARSGLEARIVLQDARALNTSGAGDVVAGPGPIAVTGAYEAWGEVHTGPAAASFVRVGRQPVVWGEGRMLGTADWSPTGRSLDAVRARLVNGDMTFELLAAALSDPTPTPAFVAYGELIGARAEWALDPRLALEVYALARLAQVNPRVDLDGTVRGQTYTGAVRVHGDGRSWVYGVEGAYQIGHADVLAAARRAWALAARVGYTFDRVVLGPTVRAGVAYASGDDGGSTYRTFDPLLPDVHVFSGAMDLFAWSNDEEVTARAAITPWSEAVASVEYRYARLAQPGGAWRSAYLTTIGRSPGNTRGDLGHEIDASLKWSPYEPLELSAGYSVAVLGDGARAITRLPLQLSQLAFVQVALQVP